MGIRVRRWSGFKDTERILSFLSRERDVLRLLEKYGSYGVAALASATPRDSGETAASWSYSLYHDTSGGRYILSFNNSNVNEGYSVAVLLQYGHATRSGTYVPGIDYINPASKEIFERLAEDLWQEVLTACRR